MSTDVAIRLGLEGVAQIRSGMNQVSKSFDAITTRAAKAGERLRAVGKDLSEFGKSAGVRVTAPIAAVGTAALLASDSVKKAMDSIRINTGASGEALKGMTSIAKDLAVTVPQSFQSIADVVSTLNTITGATGDTLQGLSRDVLDTARVLGEDAASAAGLFARNLKQFSIDAREGSQQLAFLFKVTQDTGIGFNKLSGLLNDYGTVLSNAGFTMKESAVLFGELDKAGLSVSRLMPGLNAAMRNWAKENKNIQAELSTTVDRIKNASSSTEALSIATDAFGAEGAQRLVKAIRNGSFELGNLKEKTDAVIPSIQDVTANTQTFSDKMAELGKRVTLAAAPLGDNLLVAFDKLQPSIDAVVGKVAEVIKAFNDLDPQTQKLIFQATALAAAVGPLAVLFGGVVFSIGALMSPIGLAIAGIASLAAGGLLLIKNWEKIKTTGAIIWEGVNNLVLRAIDGILAGFEKVTSLVPFVSAAFTKMRGTVQVEIDRSNAKISTMKSHLEGLGKQAEGTAGQAKLLGDSIGGLGDKALTAAEKFKGFNEGIAQLNGLFNEGVISAEQYGRGIQNLQDNFGSFGKAVSDVDNKVSTLNRTLNTAKKSADNLAASTRNAVSSSGGFGTSSIGGSSGGSGSTKRLFNSGIAGARASLVDRGLISESQFQSIIQSPPAGETFSDFFTRLKQTENRIIAQNQDVIRAADRNTQLSNFQRTFGTNARPFGGSFGTGGRATFSRPTFIQVGEQGPEQVDVTPLGRGKSSGNPVTVIFQGPNVIDDVSRRAFIRDIMQQMKSEGLRFG